jgi:uncharacterized protein (TIGR04255 family)
MRRPYVQKYERPPIIEAVIEFRFRGSLPADLVRRVADRSKKRYSIDETESTQSVILGTPNFPLPGPAWQGRRLSSADRADVLLVRPILLSVSRLAPYLGWEYLADMAREAWESLRHFDKPALSRIGMRYINRIDTPIIEGIETRVVNIFPSFPALSEFPPRQSWVQLSLILSAELQVIINSLPTDSPVPAHRGWQLDIDVFTDANIPLRDDEIWLLMERMRTEKNRIFEALITDEARELFGK